MKAIIPFAILGLVSCGKIEKELDLKPEEAEACEKAAEIVAEKLVEKVVKEETGYNIAPFLPDPTAKPLETPP